MHQNSCVTNFVHVLTVEFDIKDVSRLVVRDAADQVRQAVVADHLLTGQKKMSDTNGTAGGFLGFFSCCGD
jgi:hypothetical protein